MDQTAVPDPAAIKAAADRLTEDPADLAFLQAKTKELRDHQGLNSSGGSSSPKSGGV
jgi:hypothetical protein